MDLQLRNLGVNMHGIEIRVRFSSRCETKKNRYEVGIDTLREGKGRGISMYIL
jgi:hypothetical protein